MNRTEVIAYYQHVGGAIMEYEVWGYNEDGNQILGSEGFTNCVTELRNWLDKTSQSVNETPHN